MRYKLIVHSIGNLMLLLALAMSVPMSIAALDREPDLTAFLYAIGIALTLGMACRQVRPTGAFGRREGFVVVTLGWVVLSALGALPFLFSGTVPTFTDAFFETMSGFTTTGSTILPKIEGIPRGILFWRGLTHWLGGMGIIVLSVAIFSAFQTGTALYQAEVPGHNKERFLPRLRQAAITLWLIYAVLTLAQTLLLLAAGMPLFESVVHTFATMATGGFSTRTISVEAFGSVAYEIVIVIFMTLAGMNFTLFYKTVQKRSLKAMFSSLEARIYLAILAAAALAITATLILGSRLPLGTAFRQAVFQVVSMMTTTGFTSTNYDVWPALAKGILFFLMFVGGCTGSTAGAIKVARLVLLCKYARRQLLRVARPRRVVQTTLDETPVTDTVVHEILAFFFLYFLLFVGGALVVMATGEEMITSLSASATTLGNVGPGFGAIGPLGSFAGFNPVAKWVLSFLMLAGRLEIFTVLVLFTPGFWRK